MKYKVGDIVKLRDDLEVGEKYDELKFNANMENLKNKPVKIANIDIDGYYETEYRWYINDEMIEGLWEECKPSEQVEKYNEHTLDALRYAVENKLEPKYKLIDILNKIANGELKEGTVVVWDDVEYPYKNKCLYGADGEKLFYWINTGNLNDKVELIEPQEPTDNTKIEELKYVLEELQNPTYNESWLMNCIRANRDKLNEVICKINKGG